MKQHKNKTTVMRTGKEPSSLLPSQVAIFTSRAAVGGTSLTGNFDLIMAIDGNPYTGDQGSKYALNVVDIDLTNYFSNNLFGAYDYYRVVDVETTATWMVTPTNGVAIGGELLFAFDEDSRQTVNLTDVANRDNLQSRVFTNNKLRHVVKWKPFLVEDRLTEVQAGAQVDYVQPRNRWLNTSNVDLHRFGTMRTVAINFSGANGYSAQNDARIQIRHRVKIEMKGLKSTQPAPAKFTSE